MRFDLNKKTTCSILFVLLSLCFLIDIATFKNGHNWENSDFVGYISQAKSLLEGTIDDLISHDKFMLENSTKETGAIMGPWVYPILLSPFYYIFGPNIYVMKVVTNLFFILSLIVVFLLFQERLRNVDNLLLIAILAFNPLIADFKDNVLSDIPFFFFSLFSLFLINRFIILNKIWINRFISFFLIGLLIFISYNIRSVGLVLLPTLMLVQYFKNRSPLMSKDSVFLNMYNYVPYIVFTVLFMAGLLIFPGSDIASAYFNKLSDISMEGLIFDIKYYTVLPSRFFPFLFLKMHGYGFEYNKFSLVIYSVMLLFLFVGILKNFKKDYMYLIYMLITIPVIIFFSSRQGFRLLIPLFPFFLYFLFKGLSTVSLTMEIFNNRKPLKIGLVYFFCASLITISLVNISINSYKNIMFNRSGLIEGPYSEDSTGLFNYIKANTDKRDAIIFHEPRSMYLFADRKSFALNKGNFKFEQLLNSHAGYLACEKKDNPYKLTPEDLRKDFNCPYENETYILCSLKNNPER
jgi:hypothetical protein